MRRLFIKHGSYIVLGVSGLLLVLILMMNHRMGLVQVALIILVCLLNLLILLYISHRDDRLREEQSEFVIHGVLPSPQYIQMLKANYPKHSGRLIDYVYQGLGVVNSNSPIIRDRQSAVAFKRSLTLILRVLILGDENDLFKQQLNGRLVNQTNDDSGWYYYFDVLSNVNGLLSSLEVADLNDTVKQQRLMDYQAFTKQLVELGKANQLPLSTVVTR